MFLKSIPLYKKYSTSMSDKKCDKFNMDITDYCKKNRNRKDYISEPVQDEQISKDKEAIQHSKSCDFGN